MNTKTPAMFLQERKSYARLLSEPEWNTFRNAVFANKEKACQVCRRTDKVLQVHHIFYEQDRKPWEYEMDEVMLLCEDCHRGMHEQLKNFRKFVFGHLDPQTFKILNGALAAALVTYDRIVFAHALAEFVSNPRIVQNYANEWGMKALKQQSRKP